MKMKRMMRNPMISIIACGFVLATLIGCSDNSTDPSNLNPAGNTFGVDATVRTSDPVSPTEANEVRANAERNANDTIVIEADDVVRIAQQSVPGAEILEIHLDYDSDSLNYECVVRSGGKVYVIVISPKDGKVKEKRQIVEYYYTGVVVINVHVVPVRQACDRVREITKGDVVEANLEEIEGRPTYIIVVITKDNRYVTFYIDAETGREKRLKHENRCRGNNDSSSVDTTAVNDSTGADTTHKGDCVEVDGHKNDRGRGHYRHGNGHGYGHYFHCHCDCGCDDNGGNGGGQDTVGVISKDSARAIVKGMFDDSAAVGELALNRTNDSTAYYKTVVEERDDRYEVTLNAKTGALTEVTQTRGSFDSVEFQPPTVEGKSLVALSVARAAALAQVTGTIQSWTLARNQSENRWVYSFQIKDSATSTVKTVRVNAETGLFIETIV